MLGSMNPARSLSRPAPTPALPACDETTPTGDGLAAYVANVIAKAPPLTEQQRLRLAGIIRGRRSASA